MLCCYGFPPCTFSDPLTAYYMPVRSITIKVQITLAFKIVVWRGICVRPGHHNEGKHGDIILSPKMRGAARIALRCHPIAQMGQPRTPARLWEVEAESARPADIFSLLLMQTHHPCGSRDVHHWHLSHCGSVGAELTLLLECSFIRPHSTTPAYDYVLPSSSIRTPRCRRSLRANDRVRPQAPE